MYAEAQWFVWTILVYILYCEYDLFMMTLLPGPRPDSTKFAGSWDGDVLEVCLLRRPKRV